MWRMGRIISPIGLTNQASNPLKTRACVPCAKHQHLVRIHSWPCVPAIPTCAGRSRGLLGRGRWIFHARLKLTRAHSLDRLSCSIGLRSYSIPKNVYLILLPVIRAVEQWNLLRIRSGWEAAKSYDVQIIAAFAEMYITYPRQVPPACLSHRWCAEGPG